MALIKCQECGKDISDKAAACSNCGAPVVQQNATGAIRTSETKPGSIAHFYYLIGAFALFACAVIGVLMALLNNKSNATGQTHNSTPTNSANYTPVSSTVDANSDINRVAESKNVNGEMKEIKYSDGKLKERYYVKLSNTGNYVKNGPYVEWYENGAKKVECTYLDGNLSGTSIVFYPSGRKYGEINYMDSKLDGRSAIFYESGQKKSEVSYMAGMKDGSFKSWREDGNIEAEGTYKDNVLDGQFTVWNANGKAKRITYKDGKPKLWFFDKKSFEDIARMTKWAVANKATIAAVLAYLGIS